MAERGAPGFVACLRGLSILTQSQIQVSIDINPIFKTAVDFLRFVTMFFELISKSGPHIYHSALQLTSPSSMIRELYAHQSYSATKVVNGIAALKDSCMASVKVIGSGVWSPCGRFIATYMQPSRVSTIEVRDPNTLEVVSTLKPPADCSKYRHLSVSFSPGGRLLACGYSG